MEETTTTTVTTTEEVIPTPSETGTELGIQLGEIKTRLDGLPQLVALNIPATIVPDYNDQLNRIESALAQFQTVLEKLTELTAIVATLQVTDKAPEAPAPEASERIEVPDLENQPKPEVVKAKNLLARFGIL